MSYKKANDVLPHFLLNAVQAYIYGECIYIPRKADNKLPWGTNTETRKDIQARNREIVARRLAGCSVKGLAEHYCLSEKTIYKIINSFKNS